MSANTNSKPNSSDEGVGIALVIAIVASVPLYLWNGFVLKTIWNWFVPDIFEGAPTLDIAEAIGIGLVLTFVTYRRIPSNKEESLLEGVLLGVFHELTNGVMTLLGGLIVHVLI